MAKKKGSAHRPLAERVKTAKGRKLSSTLWLKRQLNDPFVQQSRAQGYRSRAAYKLIEIDDKFKLLKPGKVVVDLGAAPGSWSQVAAEKVGAKGRVAAIDLLPMDPISKAIIIEGDFFVPEIQARLSAAIGGKAHVVLSDMAPPSSGHAQTDHLRIMELCHAALEFSVHILKPGGAFLTKMLQGREEKALQNSLRAHFSKVKYIKPEASRSDSAEMYVLATGFKG